MSKNLNRHVSKKIPQENLEVHEKVLYITSHWDNGNQNHNETTPYAVRMAITKKKQIEASGLVQHLN